MTGVLPSRPQPLSDAAVAVLPTAVDGVFVLMLNRPPVNAMDVAMYSALVDAFDELEFNDEVRCVVVGSALERGFCGGADRQQLAALTGTVPTDGDWDRREMLATAVTERMRSLAVPTIAAIDGFAVGMGTVLACQCDIRIATAQSWFSLPELAVSRCGGGNYALRVLPQSVVRAMMFAGEKLLAPRAFELGFLSQIAAPDELWPNALSLAADIAVHDPYLLRTAKKALNVGERLDPTTANTLEQLLSFRVARRGSAS